MAFKVPLHGTLCSGEGLCSPNDIRRVVKHLWGDNNECTDPAHFTAFFKYYHEQCNWEKQYSHVLCTHQDILDMVSMIRETPGSKMSDLLTKIEANRPEWSDREGLRHSVAFATRLWLMVQVQNVLPRSSQRPRAVPWPPSSSLSDVVRKHFSQASQGSQPIKQFSSGFNACMLEKIGGFVIRWTDELSSHLRLDDKTIYLYQHASVLKCMRGCEAITSTILPKKFFDETLDSISLLLPRTNAECTAWLRKKQLDPGLNDLGPAPKRVLEYNYWREDLMAIAKAFDRHEPSTLSQWIYDRRKIMQWWTFWLAFVLFVLTIVFGLIQSVTGTIQAWASVKSLHLSENQGLS